MEWIYHDYRPEGFESWSAVWGKLTSKNKCELSVAKIGEKKYTIWWYDRGFTDIKTHIKAENFEDAKERAIKIVQNTLTKRANYWQAMLDGYNKWVDGG
jgi:hypothetical protein